MRKNPVLFLTFLALFVIGAVALFVILSGN